MAKIAKVGMVTVCVVLRQAKTSLLVYSCFYVLNYKCKIDKMKMTTHIIQKTQRRQNLFTSVLPFYTFSPHTPSQPPLLTFQHLGARTYIQSPKKSDLITGSHWARSQRIRVTATSLSLRWWMTLGKSLVFPDFGFLFTRKKIRLSSESLPAPKSTLLGCEWFNAFPF